MQKKKIATEINKALNSGMSIQTQNDAALMKNENFSWDDLTNLKEELGTSILQFCGQVNSIVTNSEIIKNLGDKKEHFEKLVRIFFDDVNEFSNKVKDIRLQHEGKTGPVLDLDEYNLYNRLAISYHSLYTELSALITPTLSDLMLTIAEVVPNTTQAIQTQDGNTETVQG